MVYGGSNLLQQCFALRDETCLLGASFGSYSESISREALNVINKRKLHRRRERKRRETKRLWCSGTNDVGIKAPMMNKKKKKRKKGK